MKGENGMGKMMRQVLGYVETLEHKHILRLAARVKAKCDADGRETFTLGEMREERRKMYEPADK